MEINRSGINPQNSVLNALRKQKLPCVIHTTNGYQLNCARICAFDQFVLIIETDDKRQMMLYKHAVSSITMSTPVQLADE